MKLIAALSFLLLSFSSVSSMASTESVNQLVKLVQDTGSAELENRVVDSGYRVLLGTSILADHSFDHEAFKCELDLIEGFRNRIEKILAQAEKFEPGSSAEYIRHLRQAAKEQMFNLGLTKDYSL